MDEKKTYDYKGTVTISTEEYRDLIEDVCQYKREADSERRDRWAAQSELNKVKEELKAVNEKLTQYKTFVERNTESRHAFKLYWAGLLQEDEDA